MPRQLVQARCDDDTTDALADFADEKGISESEALRRSLRFFLSHQGYDLATPDGGVVLADELAELRSEQADRDYRLRRDIEILLSGVAVGVIGVAVAVAAIAPTVTVLALLLAAIAPALAIGATAARRVIVS